MSISAELRRSLDERDHKRCSYCLTTEDNCGLRMHVDHIIPEVAGGETRFNNLCLACFSCNIYKGSKQTGFDSISEKVVPLFHPLQQHWPDYFIWDASKTEIIGTTPCGRATVVALNLNHTTIVRARRRWVSASWHPPSF